MNHACYVCYFQQFKQSIYFQYLNGDGHSKLLDGAMSSNEQTENQKNAIVKQKPTQYNILEQFAVALTLPTNN